MEGVYGYMVEAQQWEYCELALYGHEEKRRSDYYDLTIFYYGSENTRTDISTIKNGTPWPHNPWRKAIGLLGLAGWELVSVQHAEFSGAIQYAQLLSSNCRAYFKRPVLPERPVTEPKLILS